MKLHKGDNILVISGKYRGKKGKITEVLPKEGKIVVESINIQKKRVKARRQGEKGQTVEVAASFDASNAKFLCPKCSKAVRVGRKIADGKKYRICKKCGEAV
ncbi:MAG: 50S ribosomal protein L24 [Candidatus Spechtbacteria bacterium RIFCSPHIGHO2_02_FULL_43_15b]|uniref:Large ribosomal subunit protein uL24 n=1 Tax=Candidatus Spechtbacteria bacterium RIFCSPHIGHO2_01_FULL_43_30 TaxID=1802158 RepID=A0A1G2H8I3_9BACT|nr:MAG: 50S ribosomal protein L24 [Candidatus Spechtbacteria bacterium RIFCSPHIGHO2_01_FULL_43_30]OGZ59705.1 MAG: 50S ribosomal protein L24 [Candidatus Spechtbacteria bacterium RIFCSPHIGHO2_02_FULL_43_15b]